MSSTNKKKIILLTFIKLNSLNFDKSVKKFLVYYKPFSQSIVLGLKLQFEGSRWSTRNVELGGGGKQKLAPLNKLILIFLLIFSLIFLSFLIEMQIGKQFV